jgi:hypothetical protein
MRGTQDYYDHGKSAKSDQEQSMPRQQERFAPDAKQRSRLEKQWKFTQLLATISCVSSFIVSTLAFWTSTDRNCDNESPYARAYRAGLYSGVTGVFAHSLANTTWTDSRLIVTKEFLTQEAKRRRLVRMPIAVLLAAGLQAVAAGMNGLAVWRTVGMVGELRVVPLVAAVALYVCSRD